MLDHSSVFVPLRVSLLVMILIVEVAVLSIFILIQAFLISNPIIFKCLYIGIPARTWVPHLSPLTLYGWISPSFLLLSFVLLLIPKQERVLVNDVSLTDLQSICTRKVAQGLRYLHCFQTIPILGL